MASGWGPPSPPRHSRLTPSSTPVGMFPPHPNGSLRGAPCVPPATSHPAGTGLVPPETAKGGVERTGFLGDPSPPFPPPRRLGRQLRAPAAGAGQECERTGL
jgi:hypothetical protein